MKFRYSLLISAVLAGSLVFDTFSAPLPYTRRTRAYSGWDGAVRGDSTSIGMAGGGNAVPESIATAETQPASFALSMESLEAQINRVRIVDRYANPQGDVSRETQGGIGLGLPPWGFAFTFYNPMTQVGRYSVPGSTVEHDVKVSLKEYHFGVSRILVRDRLSVGVSAEILNARYEFGAGKHSRSKLMPRLGVLYNIGDRVVFSASFRPGTNLNSDLSVGTEFLPGFVQPMYVPAQLAAGFGYLPNRYFRMGFNLYVPFAHGESSLLADESVSVGEKTTFHPRFGMNYILLEYQHLKIELDGGAYYEASRYSNRSGRLHKTGAIDINPAFFNTSMGFDIANDYKNYIFGVGIDIVRTLRFFDIIPKHTVSPTNQTAPNPMRPSAEGMPEGLTSREPKTESGPDLEDVGQIIKDIPKRTLEKLSGETPTSSKPSKKKPKKKPRKRAANSDRNDGDEASR